MEAEFVRSQTTTPFEVRGVEFMVLVFSCSGRSGDP